MGDLGRPLAVRRVSTQQSPTFIVKKPGYFLSLTIVLLTNDLTMNVSSHEFLIKCFSNDNSNHKLVCIRKKFNYSNVNDSFEIKLTEQLASDKVCNDICRREREYLVAHSLLSDSLIY